MDDQPRETTLSVAAPVFQYEEAFSRNLGFLTEWEQQMLRAKRVAVAGTGGVGGGYILTLARFGVGRLNIADLDHFELANFNRQAGASMESIGRPKVETMAERALQINPELKINIFRDGVAESNLDEFLSEVDLYIDGLDFFVLDIRRKLFARCEELGIPTVIAAPLGMGTAFLIFRPGGMTFEEWFRLDGLPELSQYINWYVGLAPSNLQTAALVDRSRVDFEAHKGPSTVAGCELCAGVASVEGVKLLLGRGLVRAVPYYHHFDAYQGRFVVKKLRRGNRALAQRIKAALARQLLKRLKRPPLSTVPAVAGPTSTIEEILDLARWAPSGDNGQPWRFEVVSDSRVVIHVEGSGDVYDFNDGEPTLLSAGFLLETLEIAASRRGLGAQWSYLGKAGPAHQIGVDFQGAPTLKQDDLLPFVKLRSVDRKTYLMTPLTARQKSALEKSLGGAFAVEWHESLNARWQESLLNAQATDIRLRIPEAFAVHRRVIDWTEKFSKTGLPSAAIGLDSLTLKVMHWFMGDWRRMHLINRVAGTSLARAELDLLPGIFCAAHFTIRSVTPDQNKTPADILAAGKALQRFWLMATAQGLAMQPTLAPLCFQIYGRDKTAFTTDQKIRAKAERFAETWAAKQNDVGRAVVFRGRIGQPKVRLMPTRSVRRDLNELLVR